MEKIKFETAVTLYTGDWKTKKVVDTEVQPVIAVRDKDGKIEAMGVADTDEEAECWSVYARVKDQDKHGNPAYCIADFPTKEQAEKFEALVRSLVGIEPHIRDIVFAGTYTELPVAEAAKRYDHIDEDLHQPGSTILVCNNTEHWIEHMSDGKYWTMMARDEEIGTLDQCIKFLKETA